MIHILKQSWHVARISVLSLRRRLASSLSVAVTMAFVVLVLLAALALDAGFKRTLSANGSDQVLVAMRTGSSSELGSSVSREQVHLLTAMPGIAGAGGDAAASPEVIVIVDGRTRDGSKKANVALRGVGPHASEMRGTLSIVAGRMFHPGSNELIAGLKLQEAFQGFDVGSTVRLRGAAWKVVGSFSDGGGTTESELWADIDAIQTLRGQGSTVNSVRLRMRDADVAAAFKSRVKADKGLDIAVQTEREYLTHQAELSNDLINQVGKPIALLMALGALAGALCAMYGSVSDRRGELAMFRVLGYGRTSIFMGIVVESLFLALIGTLIGCSIAQFVFTGMSTSLTGANFSSIVFSLNLTSAEYATAATWAAVIGLLGGLLPALAAAGKPLVTLLHA